MYKYRKLTPEERLELVRQRKKRGFPPHAPPHPIRDQQYYFLTAACYEHRHWIRPGIRRKNLSDFLFEKCVDSHIEIKAWVILTNHYHLLAQVETFNSLSLLFHDVHGSTSNSWNKEDNATGRKVWYRYSDRAIRSEGHYYAALNYIHYNPVKHQYAKSPYDWAESSVHWYLKHFGREWLRDLWITYPVLNFGSGWDN